MWSSLLFACGVSPTVGGIPPRVLPLCAPWSELSLPTEHAVVIQCDPQHLTMHLPPSSSQTTADHLRPALTAAGWRPEIDEGSQGLVSMRYRRDGTQLVVSIIDTEPQTLVVFSQIEASVP